MTHEIKHLSDYITFAEMFYNSNYLKIVQHKNWWEFYHYSEFHAKKLGLIYYYKLQIQKGFLVLDNEIRVNIRNLYHKVFEDSLFLISNIVSSKQLVQKDSYGLFRIIGKLSTWSVIFSEECNILVYYESYKNAQYEDFI